MSDERLQRIEELLHDLNVKVERSFAGSEAAQVAETRSRLSEADRTILQAAKKDAVFDPAKVFPERIAEPTKELKLDAATKEVSKE